MRKVLALLLMVLAVAFYLNAAFAQDDSVAAVPKTSDMTGNVVITDAGSSSLVIRRFDYEQNATVEIKFIVNQDVKIEKGLETIWLDDLEMEDLVTVSYYKDDSSGDLIATKITAVSNEESP